MKEKIGLRFEGSMNKEQIRTQMDEVFKHIETLGIRLEKMGVLEFPGLNSESEALLKAQEVQDLDIGPTTDEVIRMCNEQGVCVKAEGAGTTPRNITVCPFGSTDPMAFFRLKHLDLDKTDQPELKVAIMYSQRYCELERQLSSMSE